MKKLMIAACAIAFAAVSQAATVTWATGTLYAPGPDGTGWVEGFGDAVAPDSTIGVQLLISAASDMSNPLAMTGMADSYTVNEFYGADGSATVALSKSEDGVKYYAQMIVTYGDSTLTSDIVSFLSVNAADPDFVFSDGGYGITPLSGEFSEITGAFNEKTGWQTVPEPTSGLLLLLGVAGLALRRRRA